MAKTELTPEAKARIIIDDMFEKAGWKVVDRDEYDPLATAVALREALTEGDSDAYKEADYLLFVNGQAVGVLEAKRVEIDPKAAKVRDQAMFYANHLPDFYKKYNNSLPLIYTSNGEKTCFWDCSSGNIPSKPQEVNSILTPYEIVKKLGIKDAFAGLPTVQRKGLRNCQYEAITNLEKSFRAGQKKALILLATGAGKTYTACEASYRFLSYTHVKRILYLVDRNPLGNQAEEEYATFRRTETKDPFNKIFSVDRVKTSNISKDTNIAICTIQRLYSILKGTEIIDDQIEDELPDPGHIIELPSSDLSLPRDFFDVIIIDECHRSIYGDWKMVLNYFTSAYFIGLTATPAGVTLAFFNNNIVVNYTYGQSVTDGVNVDGITYRIKTKETETGGAILVGDKYKRESKYTGKTETIKEKEGLTYTKEELNRSIINPSQIKLILETYRDVVYTELFIDPQREPIMKYLPKTLIFALNEAHANNIVKIAKEVFAGASDNMDKFVQKITYSAKDSQGLIKEFRKSKDFRIAVTCTLVATGTDVKPLEVLIFMRDVSSRILFTQMKGRGVRTISDEKLREVTPNAHSKSCYYLIDAVGVTEHAMSDDEPGGGGSGGGGGSSAISFDKLLELISHGNFQDEYLQLLASRLSIIEHRAQERDKKAFRKLSGGFDIISISKSIYKALEDNILPPFVSNMDPNPERLALIFPIYAFPEVRKLLLDLWHGFTITLKPGRDELIYKGFSLKDAEEDIDNFINFCEDKRDQIEALRIIWNNDGAPITYSILRDLEEKLKEANSHFTPGRLWNSYSIIDPDKVVKCTTQSERDALTNIIQLVRFAYKSIDKLESLYPSANQRFNLWLGQKQNKISPQQAELIKQVIKYIASNGSIDISDVREEKMSLAAQMIISFGDIAKANEALSSVSKFILYRKQA